MIMTGCTPGTQQTAMKIKIFTTGGTIDKIYFDQKSEYQVGDPQAGGVLERANVVIEYEVESILRKDSLDLTDEDRNVIKRKVYADPCDRILITHGTDSMIQTAKSLGRESGKTIVLTGSMYPAEFRNSDAIFNIGCADHSRTDSYTWCIRRNERPDFCSILFQEKYGKESI